MEYPNLRSCRVTIQSERSIVQPPVRLPIDIIQQIQQPIPKPIDFTLGMYVCLCVWCRVEDDLYECNNGVHHFMGRSYVSEFNFLPNSFIATLQLTQTIFVSFRTSDIKKEVGTRKGIRLIEQS